MAPEAGRTSSQGLGPCEHYRGAFWWEVETSLCCLQLRDFSEGVPGPVEGHEGNKSRTNLPLGNDNYFSAFALNARFGPGMQLVGTFGRDEDETKFAVDALWKFHFCSPFTPAPRFAGRARTESDVEIGGRKVTGEWGLPINCCFRPPHLIGQAGTSLPASGTLALIQVADRQR